MDSHYLAHPAGLTPAGEGEDEIDGRGDGVRVWRDAVSLQPRAGNRSTDPSKRRWTRPPALAAMPLTGLVHLCICKLLDMVAATSEMSQGVQSRHDNPGGRHEGLQWNSDSDCGGVLRDLRVRTARHVIDLACRTIDQQAMNGLAQAVPHAATAAMIAPLVGIAVAALLDWAERHKANAIVTQILHRCIEGVAGGAIEGFLAALILAGVR